VRLAADRRSFPSPAHGVALVLIELESVEMIIDEDPAWPVLLRN